MEKTFSLKRRENGRMEKSKKSQDRNRENSAKEIVQHQPKKFTPSTPYPPPRCPFPAHPIRIISFPLLFITKNPLYPHLLGFSPFFFGFRFRKRGGLVFFVKKSEAPLSYPSPPSLFPGTKTNEQTSEQSPPILTPARRYLIRH